MQPIGNDDYPKRRHQHADDSVGCQKPTSHADIAFRQPHDEARKDYSDQAGLTTGPANTNTGTNDRR
jgi:hypothetical protein